MLDYTRDLRRMFQAENTVPVWVLAESVTGCCALSMEITVHLPDDLARHPNPAREALEAVAIEGYRSGALSHHEASQILGLSRMEFDGFLKERQIDDHAYGVDDLEEDRKTLTQLKNEGLLKR